MAGTVQWVITVGDFNFNGSSSYTARTEQDIVVANGASDTALSLGGVTTGSVFVAKSDQTLTLNINSNSGTNITLSANTPVAVAGTSITALFVSNGSGTDANLTWGIWGV